jgi:very-short-patch-repair endonuclease
MWVDEITRTESWAKAIGKLVNITAPCKAPTVPRTRYLANGPGSLTERRLAYLLRGAQIRGGFRVQATLLSFRVDFLFPTFKLIIEADGMNHFTRRGRTEDAARDEILLAAGFQVLRLRNNVIWSAPEIVMSNVWQRLGEIQADARPLIEHPRLWKGPICK